MSPGGQSKVGVWWKSEGNHGNIPRYHSVYELTCTFALRSPSWVSVVGRFFRHIDIDQIQNESGHDKNVVVAVGLSLQRSNVWYFRFRFGRRPFNSARRSLADIV